ncbi:MULTISPECIES: flavin reductase family protein [Nguyenibacter]|uniref:Flavin reductase family protein n=1 Tax=Nguyenibacter vanlangensis TaxID=1216886 RepID=A0A7Y7M6D6_9PROT|nr:flavin reductase family protein [Nguyenibacter vanlangensis]
MDARELRRAFGQFATGVTLIVGTSGSGERAALTATSFNTVSLDPPLVIFSVKKSTHPGRVFSESDSFLINVLGDTHQSLSDLFGRPAPISQREAMLDAMTRNGSIGVADALAVLRCERFLVQDIGEHFLFVARVVDVQTREGCQPLLFFSSMYHGIRSINEQ